MSGSISLADVFVGLSNRWPERTAVVSGPIALSYSELIAQASRTAREFRGRGVTQDVNVGVSTPDGIDSITSLIALWMLGAVPVPIDFRTRAGERETLSKELDLKFLVQHRDNQSPAYQSICIDANWAESISRHATHPLLPEQSSATAIISLTSGTTGRPIGIVLEHSTLLFQLWLKDEIVTRGGRLLSALPLYHSGARNQTLAHLLNGGTVYFHPPLFNGAEFAAAVAKVQATDVYTVPPILRDLLQLSAGRTSPLFNHVEVMFGGGAPMSAEEKREVRQTICANLVEGYSSTMVGGITLLHPKDMDQHSESVGRVLAPVLVQIVDENDEPLPAGEAGMIRVRSPGMAHTIYGGATRAGGDRIKAGWVYPGDIGVLDRDNFLSIRGRASEMIIRNGVNVHPSEVEAVLIAIPGVRDAAVVGYPAQREGEEIAAFVVTSEPISEAQLTSTCRIGLAPDKRPRKFIFVQQLPRNASGKVVKSLLVEQAVQAAEAGQQA